MFIGEGGGTAYLSPGDSTRNSFLVTLAMTNNTGSVVVNQMGVDSSTWFPLVIDNVTIELGSENTMRSVYAPCKLQVVATGCGVRLYN